jgi:hypothetical protein
MTRRRWEKRERAAYGIARGQKTTLFLLSDHDCRATWQEHAYSEIHAALVEAGLSELTALSWHSRTKGWSFEWECRVLAIGSDAEARLMSIDWPGYPAVFLWSVPDASTKVLLDEVEGEPDEVEPVRETPYLHFHVWGDRSAEVLGLLDSARTRLKFEGPA